MFGSNGRDDLYREMDDHIGYARRKNKSLFSDSDEKNRDEKKGSFWEFLGIGTTKEGVQGQQDDVSEDAADGQHEGAKTGTADDDDKDEYEEAVGEKHSSARKGFLSRMLGMLGTARGGADEGYDEQEGEGQQEPAPEFEEIKGDMKAVAAYAIEILKYVTEEDLKKIKNDEDFKHFKDILRKHGIIR